MVEDSTESPKPISASQIGPTMICSNQDPEAKLIS